MWCGRDARTTTTRRSVEIDWGAAGLEEVAGAGGVFVIAAQDQRPPQLQPTFEPLEDLDRRVEVLARRLLIAPRSMQLPPHLEAHGLPVRHVGFAGGFEGGLEALLGFVELAGGDEGLGGERAPPDRKDRFVSERPVVAALLTSSYSCYIISVVRPKYREFVAC